MVKKDGLFGLLDETTFKEILPCNYEVIYDCDSAKKSKMDADKRKIENDGSLK